MIRARIVIAYGAMVGVTVAGFLWIRSLGASFVSVEGGETGPMKSASSEAADTLLHVLLALVVVVVVSRALGAVFRRFGQPHVLGEIVAGLLLGPSLLGRVAPEGAAFLLPATIAPHLGILAQVGVILYMFLVGLHLDTRLLKERTEASIAISHASILAPFLLGSALALWLFPSLSGPEVPFTVFALFMGVSMSVTAFPVLARILTDRGMEGTPLGALALTCAAVGDVSAWCLLALVVGVARSDPGSVVVTVLLTIVFIGTILLLVGPLVRRMLARRPAGPGNPQTALAFAFVALLLSALATESIGIHALFGAFLLGSVIPPDSPFAVGMRRKLEDFVVVLLLPVFFAFTGLRTEIGLLEDVGDWLVCGLIVLVASLGKFGGSLAAARWTGIPWRESAALGVLMNTRGLMELIVLNVGLDLGVISPRLFAMLVVMAVVTTIATTPIFGRLIPDPAVGARRGRDVDARGLDAPGPGSPPPA